MAGRRPKTSEERQRMGGGGHRPLPNDPKPAKGEPVMLSVVRSDPTARAHWKYLAGLLAGEKRLTVSDGPMLAAAAIAFSVGSRLSRIVLTGKDGDQRIPLFVEVDHVDPDDGHHYSSFEKTEVLPEERQQWERYRKAMNDLCLSAGSRARAKVPNADEKPNTLQERQQQAALGRLRRIK